MTSQNRFSMKLSREREKLLNAIIFFVDNTERCHKLKLMKLLYFLDFWHFKETGRSVTGLIYKAWDMGPVPQDLYNELAPENNPRDIQEHLFIEEEEYDQVTGKKRLVIKAKKSFNEKIFTKREIELLKKVAEIFQTATANMMKDSTHLKNSPWEKTYYSIGKYQTIDYLLALDDDEKSLSEAIVNNKIQLDKENRDLLSSI